MTRAKIREKQPAACIIFCRHGATDYPEDRFYPSERGDEPGPLPALSEEGKIQAERLGDYFAGFERVDSLYVSPTLRTRQTMEPVSRARGIEPVVIEDLAERRMGSWGGRSADEIRNEQEAAWIEWKSSPLAFSPPGGETLQAFAERISKAIGLILEKNPGGIVGVVTHVGPIRVATAAALQIPLENVKRLLVAPGSVTRIHYTQSWPNLALFGFQP